MTEDDCVGGAVQEFGRQLLQQLTQGSAGSHWSGLLWVGGGNYLHSQYTVEHSSLFQEQKSNFLSTANGLNVGCRAHTGHSVKMK